MYGHIAKMAEAVAEGVKEVPGAEVEIRRIPETLPDGALEKMGALGAKQQLSSIPEIRVGDLAGYDAIIFGTPTRFGNMPAQFSTFWDSTGTQWTEGSLIGKVGSVFASSATQHGGQETTIISFYTSLLHHGMVIAGLPYSFQGQMGIDEITGCSPYGASTISGGQGQRMPSENELAGARFQGRYVAEIASKMFS